MSLADALLRAIIVASQKTPFRARGGYSNLPRERQKAATSVDKAKAEAADHERFFGFFSERDVRAELQGKRVLDFGSGYGGRTVEYARSGAAEAYGVEPLMEHVVAGRQLAAEWGVDNAFFELCGSYDIPYPDGMFDAIVSFDVLEHVADPRKSLLELHRVLKPGGFFYAVFPVYRGMFAHHLDYITLAPALHLVFSPQRIMRVVNHLLDTRFGDIEVTRHPGAARSYLGDRYVLPTLNGMGLRDFLANASIFEVESLRLVSVAERFLGRPSLAARLVAPLMELPPTISEILAYHVCAVLRRGGRLE